MPKKIYAMELTKLGEQRGMVNYSSDGTAEISSQSAATRSRGLLMSAAIAADPLPRGAVFLNSKVSIAQKTGGFGNSDYDNDTAAGTLDLQIHVVSGAGSVVESEATWDERSSSYPWTTAGGDWFTRETGRKTIDSAAVGYGDGYFMDVRISRLLNLDQRVGTRLGNFVCRFRVETSGFQANKLKAYTDNEGVVGKRPTLTVYYRKAGMRSRRNRLAR